MARTHRRDGRGRSWPRDTCAFQSRWNSSADRCTTADSTFVSSRLDREQRALEAARCLDQRPALVRLGGQVGRVRALLRQHRAGLGDHGLRPLPPVEQGVERRGTFGAFRRKHVRRVRATPGSAGRSVSHLCMVIEPRGGNFLRARRQRPPARRAPAPLQPSRRSAARGTPRSGPRASAGSPPSSATRMPGGGRLAGRPGPLSAACRIPARWPGTASR